MSVDSFYIDSLQIEQGNNFYARFQLCKPDGTLFDFTGRVVQMRASVDKKTSPFLIVDNTEGGAISTDQVTIDGIVWNCIVMIPGGTTAGYPGTLVNEPGCFQIDMWLVDNPNIIDTLVTGPLPVVAEVPRG